MTTMTNTGFRDDDSSSKNRTLLLIQSCKEVLENKDALLGCDTDMKLLNGKM